VLQAAQPLRSAPDAEASRRGSAAREIRLPLFGARRGPGCLRSWLQVGPAAWLCGDDAELSGAAAIEVGQQIVKQSLDGLPYDYYFVSRDGSLAYARIEDTDVGEPTMSLEPGFAVAIVAERSLGKELYGLTKRGLWVPMRDLGPARSFRFHGSEIGRLELSGTIPFAWAVVDHPRLYRRERGLFLPTGEHRQRFDKVGYAAVARSPVGELVRIDDRHWMRASDLRHPTVAPPPAELAASGESRWIDVELASQTLVAYRGPRPVFATLVSTGKGKTPGHPFETPRGVHRIWVKLLTSVMDNLEDEEAARYYRIEDVPYVQYFAKGVGLHAAFWHRSFGHVRSHGCVNLAPLDARRLFAWTAPRLPTGWTAVLPATYDRGTIVRVR